MLHSTLSAVLSIIAHRLRPKRRRQCCVNVKRATFIEMHLRAASALSVRALDTHLACVCALMRANCARVCAHVWFIRVCVVWCSMWKRMIDLGAALSRADREPCASTYDDDDDDVDGERSNRFGHPLRFCCVDCAAASEYSVCVCVRVCASVASSKVQRPTYSCVLDVRERGGFVAGVAAVVVGYCCWFRVASRLYTGEMF